jgi:hypothetical protein
MPDMRQPRSFSITGRQSAWGHGCGCCAGRERQPHPSKPTSCHSRLIISSVPIADIWPTSPDYAVEPLAIIELG